MKFFNRVAVNIATTGQGTVTFGAAVTGRTTPIGSGVADGDVTAYLLVEGADFEVGVGTIGGSGTTLTRTVTMSMLAGVVGTTKMTLAGGAVLRFIERAEDLNALLRNDRLAKTAAYTLVNGDKGRVIGLGGSAFYTLTVGAASGFDADFQCRIDNEDSVRAKTMTINGVTSFRLYPGQSITLRNSNNVWRVAGKGRWKLAGGTQNFYCDFTSGNDANDGLAAGSGNAMKTIEAAFLRILDELDFAATPQSVVVINLADNTTDTGGVHYSGHALVGAQGGGALKILGGTNSVISTTSADALGLFCNVQVQLQNVKLVTTTSGNCITADLGAQVYVLSGVEFGACAGSHMSAKNGGRIYCNNNYAVSGNAATAHQSAAPNGAITGVGLTVTISANISVTYWALAANLSLISLTGMTYSLGAFAVTGKRYEADNLAMIGTNGGGASYFPGSTAGSVSVGGQYI